MILKEIKMAEESDNWDSDIVPILMYFDGTVGGSDCKSANDKSHEHWEEMEKKTVHYSKNHQCTKSEIQIPMTTSRPIWTLKLTNCESQRIKIYYKNIFSIQGYV